MSLRNEKTRVNRQYKIDVYGLQDNYIDTLQSYDDFFLGQVINPRLKLSDDGTQTFTCSIPKYYINPLTNEKVINPRWETTENGILAENIRILKVFVKQSDEQVNVYPFIIDKITDSRDSHFSIYKSVEASGLAFAELGKIGYKIEFDEGTITREEEALQDASENQDETVMVSPTLNYWLDKVFPSIRDENGKVQKWLTPWCYEVRMDWRNYADDRDSRIVYEDAYCNNWTLKGSGSSAELIPDTFEPTKEKARIVECKNSNKYNITQTIAETFEIFCRYEYKCDARGQFVGSYTDEAGNIWTGKKVIFYNRAIKADDPLVVDYQKNLDSIKRTSDSTDIYTKLYVTPISAETMTNGYVSIADTTANPLQDEFIINFDYLINSNSLTDYQKEYIGLYKTGIAEVNRRMIPLLKEEESYRVQLNELESDKAYAEKSLEAANDNYNEYNTLYNNIAAQGSVTKDENNAYTGTFVPYNSSDNLYYFLLDLQGINKNTIAMYPSKEYKKEEKIVPSGFFTLESELSSLDFSDNKIYVLLDDDGYPTKVFTKSLKDEENKETNPLVKATIAYAAFVYTPSNKYQTIRNGYASVQEKERERINSLDIEINALNELYADCKARYNILKEEKDNYNCKLETILGPALREGYWTPDSYEDNGAAREYNVGDGALKLQWQEPFGKDYKSYYTVNINEAEPQYIQYPYLVIGGIDEIMDSTSPQNVSFLAVQPFEAQALRAYAAGWYSFQVSSSLIYYVKFTKEYPEKTYFKFDINISTDGVGSGAARFGVKEPEASEYTYFSHGDDSWTTTKPEAEVKIFELFANQIIYDVFYYNVHFKYVDVDTSISDGDYAHAAMIYLPKNKTLLDNATNLVWYYQINQANKVISKPIDASNYFGYQDISSANNIAFEPHIVVEEYNAQIGASTCIVSNTRTEQTLARDTDYFTTIENGYYHIILRPNENTILRDFFTAPYKVQYRVSQANELLYLDAVDVAYDNSIPRYTYELTVANLPHEFHNFELGSILYINDHALGVHAATGYISDIDMALDEPQSDTVSIQNYKTKFEDLFSTIVAQSEAMKTNRASYDIAAKAFTSSGHVGVLAPDSLSAAITSNNNFWLNWSACGVEVTPNQGIILTNLSPYANGIFGQVILQGGGIFLSNSVDANGNRVWSAAITPDGINASLIRAGQLNTEKIMIYAGSNTAFMWDAEGIFAYKREEDAPSLKEYVKFSQYGVQVVDDSLTGWDTNNLTNGHNAIVSLNWNGLTLRNNKGEKTLEIDRGDEGGGTLKIMGTMQSERFASGILGYGWRILNDGTAEFQDVHVRGTIASSIFEYKETTAVGGELYIGPTLIVDYNRASAAVFERNKEGRLVLTVKLGLPGDKNLCGRTWQVGDVLGINCCLVNAAGTKYEIKNLRMKLDFIGGVADDDKLISSVLWDTSLNVLYDENENPVQLSQVDFNGLKASGPINCIFIGSENSDTHSRRGILLTAMADNSPYMDIYDDANSKIAGAPKVRLGNLDGLGTLSWDNYSMTPKGYGLYSDNVYLTGAIYATSGKIGSLSIDEVEKSVGQISLTLKSKIGFVYTEATNTKDLNCEVYCGNTRITKKSDLPAIYQKTGLTFTFGYYSRENASSEWVAFNAPWNSVPLFDANGNINSLLYTTTNKPTREYMARLVLSETIAGQQDIQSSVATFQYAANGEKGDKGDSIKGDNGDNAITYDIIPSVSAISRDLVVPLSPTTLEYSVVRYDGGVQTTIANLSNAGMSIKVKNITDSVESQVIETTTALAYSLENYAAGKTYGTVDSIKLELYQGSQLLTIITVPFTLGDDLRELGKIQNGQVIINDGKVYAESIASHTITAGQIQAGTITTNEIAANTIKVGNVESEFGKDLDISSNNNIGLYVNTHGVETSSIVLGNNGITVKTGGVFTVHSNNFKIDTDGNVTMNGTVTASTGKIGGWTLDENKLLSSNQKTYLLGTWDNNNEDNDPHVFNINDGAFTVSSRGSITANAATLQNATITNNGYVGAIVRYTPDEPPAPEGVPGAYLWLKPVDSETSSKVTNSVIYEATTNAVGWTANRTSFAGDNAKTAILPIIGSTISSTGKRYRYTVSFPIYISKHTYGQNNTPVGGKVSCSLIGNNKTISFDVSQKIVASASYSYRDIDITLSFESPNWIGNVSTITLVPDATKLSSSYSAGNILNSSTANKTIRVICEIIE